MIGSKLIEEFIQSVALSHLVKGQKRVSTILLAAPESGKTTITASATCPHVCRVAMITGRSILRELKDHPNTEFLLFNDLSAVRAMSHPAVSLLVVLLNQLTQDERGVVAFAGKESEQITRSIGIIACLPFATFVDHRASWREMGFVSRMIPFAYSYNAELIAEIKDAIDNGRAEEARQPRRAMPKRLARPLKIGMSKTITGHVRALADARGATLGQLGIRLLQNYHCLIRAHALLNKRRVVTEDDLTFLRHVDLYVSIMRCLPLTMSPEEADAIARVEAAKEAQTWQHAAIRPLTNATRRRRPRRPLPMNSRPNTTRS